MGNSGRVYIVGAGPGDPELLTLKGRRVLGLAGVILYDHLANDALLEFAPASAERLYVGKKRSEHAFTQEEICALMIDRARRGLTVVRLKGGDPYIFGRGGEEAEALADAGIPFEVVPGVTAALGIAAYAGAPLTHREHTSVVSFVTGHDVPHIDWDKVGASETLVVFMGLTHLRDIAREIVARGRSPETPAMAVRWATRPDQETIVGTVADLADRVERAGMKPPATVVIGEVVRLREKLNWFERLPLFGTRIAITRAPSQAPELRGRLESLGAEVVDLPMISIQPPADPAPLDAAIARLAEYDWIVFTSANGVRFFLDGLDRSPHDLRSLRARICAIGPATRRAVEDLHLKVDLMPDEYVAEALVAAFAQQDLRGRRILLPRAAVARDVIPVELARLGAEVDVVEAYRNVPPPDAAERIRAVFSAVRQPAWITFTSSSTVNNFIEIAGRGVLEGVRAASIGPVTSATLRSHGIEPAAEAREFTIDGLIAAVLLKNVPVS
ncbi:MAG: uroporphyrinogen-III C-methyltransferase [Bryobacteraceae bacterium]|jgi:uroporphyrinogen III methyltransferase/synthase